MVFELIRATFNNMNPIKTGKLKCYGRVGFKTIVDLLIKIEEVNK